ncbi:response regulator [Mucilaginibacter robiniae]|uniref:Response regulator n=1 Tax=Mucilaginibacter robiniae TaxID=2728022 RepID=A0A7L5DWB7_9SPHI|nr:response regulator [Mucilaginibacter robiniae]QJD94538.1 response regulator [Mucilaginibacter robiniae]
MVAPDILYIEDNDDFINVVERAIVQIDNKTILKSIDDGNQALQTLNKLAESKTIPKLILLDLNLPGLSGLDILKRVKETQPLRYVPVVIFSTSDNPADVRTSLEFGANAYVTKPLGYLNLVKCLSSIHEFWLNTTSTYSA